MTDSDSPNFKEEQNISNNNQPSKNTQQHNYSPLLDYRVPHIKLLLLLLLFICFKQHPNTINLTTIAPTQARCLVTAASIHHLQVHLEIHKHRHNSITQAHLQTTAFYSITSYHISKWPALVSFLTFTIPIVRMTTPPPHRH